GSLLLTGKEKSRLTGQPSGPGPEHFTMGPHFTPRAKRVIYLFMAGGPSQLETFDYKPALAKWHGEEIPDSIRGTQRNSGMVTGQSTFSQVQSIYDFRQH